MARQSVSKNETKSLSSYKAEAKLNISKYEPFVNDSIKLQAKTFIVPNSFKYKDRSTLTTIPPKDEDAVFAVGDLIWVQFPNYPYWPCMVSTDPETGNYFQIESENKTQYYVQYFGPEPSNGWTSNLVMLFEGFDKFKQKIEIEIDKAKSKENVKNVLNLYTPSPNDQKNWKFAIAEARMAMNLSPQERVKMLTFNYVHSENSEKLKKNRMIEFQHNGVLKRFPASFNFNIHFSSASDDQSLEEENLLETPELKNSKVKVAKDRLTEKRKASSSCQTPAFKTNSILPQPKFHLPTDMKEYEEPMYSSAAYVRANVNKKVKQNNAEKDYAEYDMDEEDLIWLDEINKTRRAEQLLPVDRYKFELMMETLETEWYKHNQQKLIAFIENDDVVCSICNDGECYDSNAIIFCDMCTLAVHQECYGIPYIPKSQWLCSRCRVSPNRPVDCVLCPNKGGAFKCDYNNHWAHVICALWIPEMCFKNTVYLEPIDGIDAIPQERWNLTCCICKKKKEGACIKCCKNKCCAAFHVTCAKKAGFHMKIDSVIEKGPQGVPITKMRKLAYCINHGPKKTDTEKSVNKFKDDKVENNESSQSSIDDKISLPADVLRQISSNLNFPKRNDFLLRLYAYWRLKRLSRNGAHLINHSQNSIPLNKLVQMKKKTGNKSELEKLQSQKIDLENCRELLRKMKCQLTTISPISHFLNYILEEVTKEDVNKFFAEPVDTTANNDNLNLISKPINFETMKKMVQFSKYTSIDAFKSDLQLIINSCKNNNKPDTIRHETAIKLEKFIDELFKKLQPIINTFAEN